MRLLNARTSRGRVPGIGVFRRDGTRDVFERSGGALPGRGLRCGWLLAGPAGDFSKWRRGSVSCWTDGASLDSRHPLSPVELENRTGSWCDREDGICNNNPEDLLSGTAHGSYTNEGAEMDERLLKRRRPSPGSFPTSRPTST